MFKLCKSFVDFFWLRSLSSAFCKLCFLLRFFWLHQVCIHSIVSTPLNSPRSPSLSFFQVPQLNRRPEAPWHLPPPVSLLLLFTGWCSATGLPASGQHLQPPSHPLFSTWVLASSHTNSYSTGSHCRYQAQARTTLLRQHRHTAPEQVRRACVLCLFMCVKLQRIKCCTVECEDMASRGLLN